MTTMVSQESVVASVSRTGRDLQRYRKGRRQVVGFVSSLQITIFVKHIFFYNILFNGTLKRAQKVGKK